MTENKHNLIDVAEAQLAGKTLYCGGLDIHPFGGLDDLMADWQANMKVYGFRNGEKIHETGAYDFYRQLFSLLEPGHPENKKVAGLLAAIEDYTKYVIEICVRDCNVRVFKPQFGLYIQLGVLGVCMLQRLRRHIQNLENELGIRLPTILDCKPGDIFSTQQGYMLGFMGNWRKPWGIDYTPFDFDIINPTPWMGSDVLVLEDKNGKPLYGLELLREGKCLIYVNNTSNPSGPQYQSLQTEGNTPGGMDRLKELDLKPTLSLVNAADAYCLSQKHNLEEGSLSQLGLVVGSTHACDGSIRRANPTCTMLDPGFGAQSVGKKALDPFIKIMLELIPEGKWNGQGNIFSSSRGTMFAWDKKYGGSGNINKLRVDLISSTNRHRELEEEAYQLPQVIDAGIINPFIKAA